MNRTLLLVDDCPTILTAVRIALEDQPFRIESANDGQEALGRIQRGLRPDLIITDLNMPRMGGIELVRAVRALLPLTPMLLMSVETLRPLREQAREAGAAGWIVKPVGREALIDAIHRVMRKAPA